MEKSFVRLMNLNINNIKNVINGSIQFESNPENRTVNGNSIRGIYGQNGSGKTAVVDVMYLLQRLLKGETLPSNLYKYINYEKKEAIIQYQFYIETEHKKYDIEYCVGIRLLEEKRFVLSYEKLYGSVCNDGKWSRKGCILEYNIDVTETLFKPIYRNEALMSNLDYFIQAKVAQQFTKEYDEEKKISSISSLFFSKGMEKVFGSVESFQDIYEITQILIKYATEDLIVVQNEDFGLIDMNISKIVFHVNMMEKDSSVVGMIPIRVDEKNILPTIVFKTFCEVVEQTNQVINALVPNVKLEISNKETKYTKEGEEGISFELVTMRGSSVIPFECESSGIKKLISICTALIACYNRSSVCLVIDEFDSGIFEYLLGELLEIMQEYAKGQLIFTSHNLRALEVLDRDSLVFTTLDPERRYGNLKYVKNTQNKRLSYLRAIYLDGQDIPLYESTSQAKIKRALRKSWR